MRYVMSDKMMLFVLVVLIVLCARLGYLAMHGYRFAPVPAFASRITLFIVGYRFQKRERLKPCE